VTTTQLPVEEARLEALVGTTIADAAAIVSGIPNLIGDRLGPDAANCGRRPADPLTRPIWRLPGVGAGLARTTADRRAGGPLAWGARRDGPRGLGRAAAEPRRSSVDRPGGPYRAPVWAIAADDPGMTRIITSLRLLVVRRRPAASDELVPLATVWQLK
jgi:hypothetical protein